MKYMGSKKYMLKNGLGKMILKNAESSKRIVDLFCGAGSVAWFAGECTGRPIIGIDLQSYATIYTGAVIGRDRPLDAEKLRQKWVVLAQEKIKSLPLYKEAVKLEKEKISFSDKVRKARMFCESPSLIGPVFNAYGGHYFSPIQSLAIDLLLRRLPRNSEENKVCHAALIQAASICAASPGHTAQPFQPTKTAIRFIKESWKRDIFEECVTALSSIAPKHAMIKGEVLTSDAFEYLRKLKSGDLVIVDPPYSEVQYSRFYHVLETIARKKRYKVSGIGRYPDLSERPHSRFSLRSESKLAMEELLKGISARGATLILTFPANDSSNGLSGDIVMDLAKKYFTLNLKYVYGVFSTLGGNNHKRDARQKSKELILLMKPK